MRYTGAGASFLIAIGVLACAPVAPTAFAAPGADGSDNRHSSQESSSDAGDADSNRSDQTGADGWRGRGNSPHFSLGSGRETPPRDDAGSVTAPPARPPSNGAGGREAPEAPAPPDPQIPSEDLPSTPVEVPTEEPAPVTGDGGEEPVVAQPPVVEPLPTAPAPAPLPIRMSPLLVAHEFLVGTEFLVGQDLHFPSLLPKGLFPLELFPGEHPPLAPVSAESSGSVAPAGVGSAPQAVEITLPKEGIGSTTAIPGLPSTELPLDPTAPGLGRSVPGAHDGQPSTWIPMGTPKLVRANQTTYATTSSTSDLVANALPGLAGILIATTVGSFVGFRQIRAGAAAEATGAARFMP